MAEGNVDLNFSAAQIGKVLNGWREALATEELSDGNLGAFGSHRAACRSRSVQRRIHQGLGRRPQRAARRFRPASFAPLALRPCSRVPAKRLATCTPALAGSRVPARQEPANNSALRQSVRPTPDGRRHES